jgi:hypothetical protein
VTTGTVQLTRHATNQPFFHSFIISEHSLILHFRVSLCPTLIHSDTAHGFGFYTIISLPGLLN